MADYRSDYRKMVNTFFAISTHKPSAVDRVFVMLGLMADADGVAFASIYELAYECNINSERCRIAIKNLIAKGFISVVTQPMMKQQKCISGYKLILWSVSETNLERPKSLAKYITPTPPTTS